MKIKAFYKTLTSKRKGAQLALSNRLFVNGWNMGSCLRDFLGMESPSKMITPSLILIVEDDYGKPIAASIVINGLFQVFVRVKHRRIGIGSMMYRKSKELLKKKKAFSMLIGDDRARIFYDHVKSINAEN